MLLHSTQSKVAESRKRFRVVRCGRRWGKTTEAVEEIKGKALYQSSKIAYIAPTYQQARDIAWALLIKELQPIIIKVNESRLELEIRTVTGEKSLVVLRGWESIETLRGQSFDFIVIDEVASMRNFWANWEEIVRPTLTDRRGEALFISTPKGFNHFYELYNLSLTDNDYESFHFTTYDNPFIPRDEVDKAKKELTEDRFSQEYLADFRKTEGLVYKEFDRDKHIFTDDNQIKNRIIEVFAGVDFGFRAPCAIIDVARDTMDNFWVTREFYKTEKTEEEIAEVIAQGNYGKVYPDPESPSAIEVLKRKKINVREVIKNKDSIKNGINVVRELLKANKLKIHSSCSNLIFEFETYSYPEKKDMRNENEDPIKENDHALDALRYALSHYSVGLSDQKVKQFVPKKLSYVNSYNAK